MYLGYEDGIVTRIVWSGDGPNRVQTEIHPRMVVNMFMNYLVADHLPSCDLYLEHSSVASGVVLHGIRPQTIP